ncbi:MAG: tRNA (N(6)-L-threonylcarbamoyladenosine(37)-C(2))-methylthiotransferase MtaB [Ruminococcaceae bacterium]|nr:tRNA (N(6)-L-threonylcarbamoyladenosine(37)-C(2))-methylthiotransferase MtaB [Oscillospiraceae bacterium]
MKVYFYTLGCKVNQYETQSMREIFETAGYTVSSEQDFDIAVINSCTVTAESNRKTRQVIHRLKRKNPDAIIVLTGCMAQAFSKESSEIEDVDIVVGNTDITKVFSLTQEFLQQKNKIFNVSEHERYEHFNTPSINDFAERTRSYMKIEDGCERYCTYCIIPFARGFVRSKPLREIKREAKVLADKGFREIVLVGINLSAYGKGEDFNLCDAVDAVCQVDGIKRVRLGSLEPDHISDEMLERFKNQEKFCPQFHLSLQSGSDATLKRMNRHYDKAFYLDLVNRIRAMFPDAAITTDIMVGFAGETEEEFSESLEFLKEVGFAKAHVFAYSRREGTVAFGMPNQVTNTEKQRRSKIMLEAAAQSETAFLERQKGKTVPVLFETEENGCYFGYTPNYSRVCVKSEEDLSGEIKNVEITSCENGVCYGKLV